MRTRIESVDALRGWTLLLITVIHFMEQYLGAMAPSAHLSYASHGKWDSVIEAVGFILIRGKEYSIFSFLFGLGFALQMQQAEATSEGDFRPKFALRLLVFGLIGFLHGLIYGGDILLIFALLGLPMLAFYRTRDRWILPLALLLICGLPRILYKLLVPVATPEALAQAADLAQREAVRHWDALTGPSFLQMVHSNLTISLKGKAGFQLGLAGRGYQSFGFFLLGLWAGRHRFFEDVEAHLPLFKKIFKVCAIPALVITVAALIGSIYAVLHASPTQGAAGVPSNVWTWPIVVGISLYDAWNLAATLFYMTGFLLLCRYAGWWRLLRHFAPVGRMTLTNYLAQSVIGALLFMGFGFGLLGRIGSSLTLPIGIAVFTLGAIGSALWLKAFCYGPMEWLWRSLMLRKCQPFLRR